MKYYIVNTTGVNYLAITDNDNIMQEWIDLAYITEIDTQTATAEEIADWYIACGTNPCTGNAGDVVAEEISIDDYFPDSKIELIKSVEG